MSDLLKSYETGLKRLLELLGKDHPDYNKALAFQTRLAENIEQTRLFRDTPDRQSERTEIIYALNEFTGPLIGQSFSELCEIHNPPPPPPPLPLPPPPELSVDFLTLACKYINAIQNEVLQAYKVFRPEGGDVWPYQCTKIITAFQKWEKPLLPNNLPLSSLEVKLSYVHEQTHACMQCINDFSPYGLQRSERAINKHQAVRQKLGELIAECNATIVLINASDELAPSAQRCASLLHNENE